MASRKLGKKVQMIECRDGANTRVKVEIRMLLTNGSHPTRYWAECTNIPGFETDRVDSIDQAIRDANAKMREHRSVEWEDKLVLLVGQGWNSRNAALLSVPKNEEEWAMRTREKQEHGIEIEVRFVQVGLVGGKVMHRTKGEQPQDGLPERSNYSGDESILILDDTRENRIAVNAVFVCLQQVRDRLAFMLGEDHGAATIKKIVENKSGPLLLAGPMEETSGKKNKKPAPKR